MDNVLIVYHQTLNVIIYV